jgi:hypothetical protein
MNTPEFNAIVEAIDATAESVVSNVIANGMTTISINYAKQELLEAFNAGISFMTPTPDSNAGTSPEATVN